MKFSIILLSFFVVVQADTGIKIPLGPQPLDTSVYKRMDMSDCYDFVYYNVSPCKDRFKDAEYLRITRKPEKERTYEESDIVFIWDMRCFHYKDCMLRKEMNDIRHEQIESSFRTSLAWIIILGTALTAGIIYLIVK